MFYNFIIYYSFSSHWILPLCVYVCMCVCVYIYIYMYTHIYTQIQTHTTQTHTHKHTHTQTHAHTNTQTQTHTHTNKHKYTQTHTRIHGMYYEKVFDTSGGYSLAFYDLRKLYQHGTQFRHYIITYSCLTWVVTHRTYLKKSCFLK